MKTSLKHITVIFSIFTVLAFAQAKEFVDTLNGFRLGQLASVPAKTFGKPYQAGKLDNGSEYEAFVINKKNKCYMVFEYSLGMIRSIQYTGEKSAPLFKGLALGAKQSDVLKVLGKPEEKETIEAEYGETWKYYQDKNYSVEIEPAGKLSSIKIIDNSYKLFPKDDVKNIYDVEKIGLKLRAKDKKLASTIIDPGIEIYLPSKKILAFRYPWQQELEKDSSEVFKFLFDKKKGLLILDQDPKVKYEENLRVTEKMGTMIVYKFSKEYPIKEIVIRKSLGQWLIWEIACR